MLIVSLLKEQLCFSLVSDTILPIFFNRFYEFFIVEEKINVSLPSRMNSPGKTCRALRIGSTKPRCRKVRPSPYHLKKVKGRKLL